MKKTEQLLEFLGKIYDKGEIAYNNYSILYDKIEEVNEIADKIINDCKLKPESYEKHLVAVSFMFSNEGKLEAGTINISISYPSDTRLGIAEIQNKLKNKFNENVAILNIIELKY